MGVSLFLGSAVCELQDTIALQCRQVASLGLVIGCTVKPGWSQSQRLCMGGQFCSQVTRLWKH